MFANTKHFIQPRSVGWLLPRSAQPCRYFAWQKKWKQKAPRRKDKRKSADQIYMEKLKEDARRREKKHQKKMAKSYALPFNDMSSSSESELGAVDPTRSSAIVPPALLLPTGSPHVYISKFTAQTSDIDPRDLFPPHEMEKRPALFHSNTFVYDGVETFQTNNPLAPASKTPSGRCRYDNAPQVAFLGRSNVGKSSLVNALMRKDLARCSKQPGRTQQVHRFALITPDNNSNNSNSKRKETCWGIFLDLPGYGYAVAPDDVLEDWQSKTQQVLQREYHQNGNLRRIYLLIDARQGVTAVDQTVLHWLQETGQIPHTLVWTKSDAVSKPQLIKGLNQAFMLYQQQLFVAEEEGQSCFMNPIIYTTSTKAGGQGLVELLSAIEAEFLVEDM